VTQPILQPIVRVRGLDKSYGSSRVLSNVSVEIRTGRVHALVGENGAGKSTLVKIITGIIAPDAGEILVAGEPVRFKTPMEARNAGIVAVYQDPRLFPHLDVAENIFLGKYPVTWLGSVNRRKVYAEARACLRRLHVDIDPQALVAGLSMAQLQFVEIARALSSELQLLILDEPTSALTPSEADKLFQIIRQLRDQGRSTLFISHRLEEVEAIADDITVLRDGRHIATQPASSINRSQLVQMMVGRQVESLALDRRSAPLGDEVLSVSDLSLRGVFSDVSFNLRKGEIVGMAGLVGAGRSEIAQSLFGMSPPTSGAVVLKGEKISPHDPAQMLRAGLAYLPEDRDGQGLIMAESVLENMTLPILSRLSKLGVIDRRKEEQTCEHAVHVYGIKTSGITQTVSSLSGGNRQKVAIAKWLATDPTVLILDEPTHGVDVGSKAQIHKIILSLAQSGLAVLVISSDLPEVLALSDHVLVVTEGRVVADIDRAEATQERIMAAATLTREAVDDAA
jgi:rhamnose transport system ATP-binding protein